MYLNEALLMVFRMEPGATAQRASEMIDGSPKVSDIRDVCAQMVAEGKLTVDGAGWKLAPQEDPGDVARAALAEIIATPAQAVAIANRTLDRIGRTRGNQGQGVGGR